MKLFKSCPVMVRQILKELPPDIEQKCDPSHFRVCEECEEYRGLDIQGNRRCQYFGGGEIEEVLNPKK